MLGYYVSIYIILSYYSVSKKWQKMDFPKHLKKKGFHEYERTQTRTSEKLSTNAHVTSRNKKRMETKSLMKSI